MKLNTDIEMDDDIVFEDEDDTEIEPLDDEIMEAEEVLDLDDEEV